MHAIQTDPVDPKRQPDPLYLPIKNMPGLYADQGRDTLLMSCKPFDEADPGDIVGIFVEISRYQDQSIRMKKTAQFLVRSQDGEHEPRFIRRHWSVLPPEQEAVTAITAMRIAETLVIDRRSLFRELDVLHPPRRSETHYEVLFTPDFAVATYQLYNDFLLNFEEDEIGQYVIDECLRLLVPGLDSSHEVIEFGTRLPAICDFINTVFTIQIVDEEIVPLQVPDISPLMESGFTNSGKKRP